MFNPVLGLDPFFGDEETGPVAGADAHAQPPSSGGLLMGLEPQFDSGLDVFAAGPPQHAYHFPQHLPPAPHHHHQHVSVIIETEDDASGGSSPDSCWSTSGMDLVDEDPAALTPLSLSYMNSLTGSNPSAAGAVALPPPAFAALSAAAIDDDGSRFADSRASSPCRSESDGEASSPALSVAAPLASAGARPAAAKRPAVGHKRKARSESGSDSEGSDASMALSPTLSASTSTSTSAATATGSSLASTPAASAGSHSGTEQADDKQLLRQARNRRSAQLSRERKKIYLQNLETEAENLRRENEKLARENRELESRLEDVTADNERLRRVLAEAGLPQPAMITDDGAMAKRRRFVAPAVGASASTAVKSGAGLALFALVFSLGVFMSGLPAAPGAGMSPVSPGLVPGRVLTPLPALPSPDQHSISAFGSVPGSPRPMSTTSMPSSVAAAVTVDASDPGLAVTEFRRPALPSSATTTSANPVAAVSLRRLTAEPEDTDSDGGDSPDLHLRHTPGTPLRHRRAHSGGDDDDASEDGHPADTHYRLTEENLKQLFDLLRSMQGSDQLFAAATAGSTAAAAAPVHHLFSPNAIRFELPGTAAKPAPASPASPPPAAGDDDSEDAEDAVLLKIWVPSLTLKSSLVRQDDQHDVWYPNLEQVDWSDLELGSVRLADDADGKLVVVPSGVRPPANGAQRLFHSGFTEISCTVRGLRDVLLVADS